MSTSLIRKLPAVHSSVYLGTAASTPTAALAAGQTLVLTNVVNPTASAVDLKLDVTGGNVFIKIPAATSVLFDPPHRVASGNRVYAPATTTIGYFVEG